MSVGEHDVEAKLDRTRGLRDPWKTRKRGPRPFSIWRRVAHILQHIASMSEQASSRMYVCALLGSGRTALGPRLNFDGKSESKGRPLHVGRPGAYAMDIISHGPKIWKTRRPLARWTAHSSHILPSYRQ